MTDNAHTARYCRMCRFSEAFSGPPGHDDLLYCNLREEICKHPCPGFERYPGCQGDDD